MPVYDYLCPRCGPFTAIRPMAEFAVPRPCPACGAVAARALLSAPAFAGMAPARRQAEAVNERSANAPRRAQRHAAGCGCCAPRPRASASPQRPWMLGH
jgi:putative FmdB family regulatory protein